MNLFRTFEHAHRATTTSAEAPETQSKPHQMTYRERMELIAMMMLKEAYSLEATIKWLENTSQEGGWCQTYIRETNSVYEYSLS